MTIEGELVLCPLSVPSNMFFSVLSSPTIQFSYLFLFTRNHNKMILTN